MTGDWMDKIFSDCKIEVIWGASRALIFIMLKADIVSKFHMF